MDYLRYTNTYYSDLRAKFSSIEHYNLHVTEVVSFCPKEFFFRNLARYYPLQTAPSHIYSLVGTKVHKFISEFLKGNIKSPDDRGYFYEGIDGYEPKFDNAIDNFLDFYNRKYDELFDGHTVVLSEVSKSKIVDERISLIGTYDLLVKDGDKSVIVDFKSSSYSPSGFVRHSTQLGGYKYLFDLNNTDGYILYLGGSYFVYKKVDLDMYRDRFVAKLNDVVKKINDMLVGMPITANVGFQCAMCDFRSICNGADIPEDYQMVDINTL